MPPLMDADIGKLRWRCRRGMKELDLLLTRYVDERYRQATPGEQQAFRQLLDTDDPLLYAYFIGGQSPPDAVLSSLLQQIAAGAVNDR
jgi:antitoxin CptB